MKVLDAHRSTWDTLRGSSIMRPHRYDQQHNLTVGRAFRLLVGDLVVEGYGQPEIDQMVGEQVNAVAQAAYDMGVREVRPSKN